MKINIEIDQDTIESFAGGIGALRALVAQQTFEKEDIDRIKDLFKQIEHEYNERIEIYYEEVKPGEKDYELISETRGEETVSLDEFMQK